MSSSEKCPSCLKESSEKVCPHCLPSSAHTPGPWTLFRSPDWKKGEYEVLHKESWGHRLICRMEDAYLSSDEPEQHLANARLIAAAPELLFNLQQMVIAIEQSMLDCPASVNGGLLSMKKAIAKAEGRA